MDKDPLPYYYDLINRNALIVRPKQPFFDWLNKTFNEEHEITSKDELNIYLIRELDDNKAVIKWIKKNFDNIFVNELNDWYTDESGWPQNRNFKMFNEWFDVEFHSMILDMEDDEIIKE